MSREFLKFWIGQSVSRLGNQFTLLALPIAAAVTLHADAARMGVLGAMRFGPGILFALPNQQSIRQAVTPDRLLGGVHSGVFVLVAGAGVVGSLLGERSANR